MATICASRLSISHKKYLNSMYTYGSPRVGDQEFVDNLHVKHYRFVNNNDIVPLVPYLNGFEHHGNIFFIDFNGDLHDLTCIEKLNDNIKGRFDKMTKEAFLDSTEDHATKF